MILSDRNKIWHEFVFCPNQFKIKTTFQDMSQNYSNICSWWSVQTNALAVLGEYGKPNWYMCKKLHSGIFFHSIQNTVKALLFRWLKCMESWLNSMRGCTVLWWPRKLWCSRWDKNSLIWEGRWVFGYCTVEYPSGMDSNMLLIMKYLLACKK